MKVIRFTDGAFRLEGATISSDAVDDVENGIKSIVSTDYYSKYLIHNTDENTYSNSATGEVWQYEILELAVSAPGGVAITAFESEVFTASEGQTVFQINEPAVKGATVYVDGMRISSYSIEGDTITLTQQLYEGSVVIISYFI